MSVPSFHLSKVDFLHPPTFTEAFHAHILNGQLHSYHIRPNFAFPNFLGTRFRLLILGAPSLEGNLTLFYWVFSHCLPSIEWGGQRETKFESTWFLIWFDCADLTLFERTLSEWHGLGKGREATAVLVRVQIIFHWLAIRHEIKTQVLPFSHQASYCFPFWTTKSKIKISRS
jgi:hypothetical protein